ncbi:hypothetical protein M0812_14382 [Anaeramoeba flamelloides]|uniref:Homeobox domain-containing protein n=1 Tax=Anaeramoeba flamelloides TaxID=1746091 RepID=A0AAV7ZII5_9EUKA|nr:hypothetical protein M0812_14382 [Anaeramoeba flamelloides]
MYFLKANNEINEITKPIKNDQEDLMFCDTLIPYNNYPKPYENYDEYLVNKENTSLGLHLTDLIKEKDLGINEKDGNSNVFGDQKSLSELVFEAGNHFTCNNMDDFDHDENSFEKENMLNLRQKKITTQMNYQPSNDSSQQFTTKNSLQKQTIKTNRIEKQGLESKFRNKAQQDQKSFNNSEFNGDEMNFENPLPLELNCDWFYEDQIQNDNYTNLNEQSQATNSIFYQKKKIGATAAVNKEQKRQPRDIKIEKKGLSNLSYNQKLYLDNILENKISINNIFLSEPSIINFVSKKKRPKSFVNSLSIPNNHIDAISQQNRGLNSKALNNPKATKLVPDNNKLNNLKRIPKNENIKHRKTTNSRKKKRYKKKTKKHNKNKNKNKNKKKKKNKKTKAKTKKKPAGPKKEIKNIRKRSYPNVEPKPGKTTKKYKLKIGRATNQGGKGVLIRAFEVPITIRCRTSQFAQRIFEKWFLNHCHTDLGPYPDQKTQKVLASEAKTSILRVVRWFGQRRRIEKEKWEVGKIEKPKWIRKQGKVKKFI